MADSGWSANGYGGSNGWNTFPPSAGSNFIRPPTCQQTPGFQAGGRSVQGGYGSGNIGGINGAGFDMGVNGSRRGLYMDASNMGGFDMGAGYECGINIGAVNGGGIGLGAVNGGGFDMGAVNRGGNGFGMNGDNGGRSRMGAGYGDGRRYSMNEASRWGGGHGCRQRRWVRHGWKRNVHERADIIPNTCWSR